MRRAAALAIAIALTALAAPVSAQTRRAPGPGHYWLVGKSGPPIPVDKVYFSQMINGRHGARSYLVFDGDRVIAFWTVRPPRHASSYTIDRRIRERLIFSTERTMDGFGCLYNPVTATDDVCVPR